MLKYFLFLLAFTLGCNQDYEIRKIPETPVPDIEVTPLSYSFDTLNVGEFHDNEFLITNVGTEDLRISDISLFDSSSTFHLVAPNTDSLNPGEQTLISVEFSPLTYSSNSAYIIISSNDPDEPAVRININGEGSAPVISVTPDYYDFDYEFLGCEETIDVEIKNIGNVDLEIYDIDYLANVPADMHIHDFYDIITSLPMTLAPDELINLSLTYAPLDTLNDASILQVYSNDPATPVASANQIGNGEYESLHTETFEQDGIVDVDILFVVDNSGSMGSNQTNLKNNFSSFISVFSAAGASYQIAFITTDDPSFVNGQVVSNLSSDPVSEANSVIDMIGTTGSHNEKGIEMAYEAVSSGGDAAPGSSFLRDDARLIVIFVSDEPDRSTAVSDSDLISQLTLIKSSLSLITSHAVAGDYPSGCSSNGGAQFGDGYYDVVSAFSGTFLSICSDDWGIELDHLARESLSINQFMLQEPAIEESISVSIDGSLTTDWTYEESSNSVILGTIPPDGSEIIIDYASWGCI